MKNVLFFLCLVMISCNNNDDDDANETGDKDSSAIHYNGSTPRKS